MSKPIPIPTAEAMRKRYANTVTRMRDRRKRREKDARNSAWKKGEE
jgi:hypothetical protein